MYNAQNTADRIKQVLILKGITGKEMCKKCNLGINTLSNIRRGDVKSIETFSTIADFLGVSVDYLIGRTEAIAKINSHNTISGNNNIIGNGNSICEKLPEQETALLGLFKKFDVVKQARLLAYAAELDKEV